MFAECETEYRFWPSRVEECKDGAQSVVFEKLNDCVATSDCRNLGELAASGVVSTFCMFYSDPDAFFPVTCLSVAKNRCKDQVIDLVQGYADSNSCL